MMNGKLAASGNVPLDRDASASQLAGLFRNIVGSAGSALNRLDKRAQRFLNQQAQVRSRKAEKPVCGWGRYESFD